MQTSNLELSAKQQLALNTIKVIGEPTGITRIFQTNPGCFDSKDQLKSVLDQLCKYQLVKRQGNGQYKLLKIKPSAVSTQKPTATAHPKGTKTPAKQPPKVTPKNVEEPAVPEPIQAINRLANRIQQDPIIIDDVDLKLAVLERLGAILEPSITEVLEHIQQDLTNVNKSAQAGEGPTMPISKEKWEEIQKELESFFPRIEFRLGNERITVKRAQTSESKHELVVYINNEIQGTWYTPCDNRPECVPHVWRKRTKAAYTAKNIKEIEKAFGKREAKKRFPNLHHRHEYHEFSFPKASVLVKQFKRIDGLELVSMSQGPLL